LEKQKALLTELLPIKGGLALVKFYLVIFGLCYAKAPTKSNVKVLKAFCRFLYTCNRNSGTEFLILYLKTCSVLLQQYCARQKSVTPSRAIAKVGVAVTRRGLPRIIPRVQRRLIRRGDPRIISLWLSLFNTYRYLMCKHKSFNAKTITDSFTGDQRVFVDLESFIPPFWEALKVDKLQGLRETAGRGKFVLSEKVSALITMASGVTGTSYEAIMAAVFA